MYFEYGERETDYLSRRDARLGEAIARIGPIRREGDDEVFSSVVHHILGQQISTAAQATLWKRLTDRIGTVDAERLLALGREELQSVGTTYKKADYILDFADRVRRGAFDVEALTRLPDEEVVEALSALQGVGRWTAEMIMTFCMRRPDVVSFGDLAILRGMRMLYRHRKLDRAKFERYRKRYSPYGTVASLYLWAIAGGALPELTDPAPKKPKKQRLAAQKNAAPADDV
ncbi:MAG: DNA-3-methyladenine glycosylase 2 family protein [Eubacteriales bacterium]|nr:DNA-3-methyladenine glycosylase 2 family protein [Eubacteriales bacterium]